MSDNNERLLNVKQMLKDLCSMPSVSGREHISNGELLEKYKKYFDDSYTDKFGNVVFLKKSKVKNAPKMLIDAHFDEIGFIISSIEDGGFLHVCNIGGIDTRNLPSAEVKIYGKKVLDGVIASNPPHLQSADDAKKTPKTEEILIDTGYSKEELEKIVSVGDAVEFGFQFIETANDCVITKSLDNKACVCACLSALCNIDTDRLKYDVYLTFSSCEETGKCGARLVSYDIDPDYAIITDVNFARGEGIKKSESIEMGAGASVDISALSSKPFSKFIMNTAEKNGLPYQIICEPDSTGTNNELLMISGTGVITAVMSVPLKSMHTPSETVCARDILSLSDILTVVLYTSQEEEI